MEPDQTLKILKMVQEGFLTPEQGQRLIEELLGKTESRSETPPRSESPDLFRMVEDAGRSFSQGFERLFGFAGQSIKDGLGLGPKAVVLKVLDAEGDHERYRVSIPYKIFTALKPILVTKPQFVVHPLQQIDYLALFESLEAGHTGRVFEYVDHARGDRLEVWVE